MVVGIRGVMCAEPGASSLPYCGLGASLQWHPLSALKASWCDRTMDRVPSVTYIFILLVY